MVPSDVVFSLTGDVRKNSRAIRQLRALQELGCKVCALMLESPAAGTWQEPGVTLQPVPLLPGSGSRFFARVHRRFREEALHIPARIYHASDLFTLPAMAAAAHRNGGTLVYDARELYPHVAATVGRPWVRFFWQKVEQHFISQAAAVFTVSEGIASRLEQTYRIPRPTVLYNVPERQRVKRTHILREQTGLPLATTVILHQGQMQKDRGCTLLVEAMKHVTGAALVFLGSGPLKPVLQQQAASLEERVIFLDPVSPDALLPVTSSADIGVTLLEDTCLNHRLALPNKLFEYVMAGLPVLGSDLPEIRNVVSAYDVGCVVDPSNAAALVSVLQYMVDGSEERLRWAGNTPHVLAAYNWEQASERFKHSYRPLL